MTISHNALANAIRILSLDAVEKAASGHPGMPMGMADVATVLFKDFLRFNPTDADWPNRDRFVLSAGHGSMLLYSLLYLTGHPECTLDQIRSFRQWGSLTAGHPEYGHMPGIETTTGPLGQGLATAVGLAVGERLMNARVGDDLINHFTYVIASDGDLMEGVSQEAISLAGHLRLHKLIVLFDDNDITIDGRTSLSTSDDALQRFQASGWKAMRIDGHDPAQIQDAISQAQTHDRPTLIACKTTIAKGAPTKAGTSSSHGSPLGAAEVEATRKALNWPNPPFEIPADILAEWRAIGQRHQQTYQQWQDRYQQVTPEQITKLKKAISADWHQPLNALKEKFANEQPKQATRQLSQTVLETLVPQLPNLVGGSADLSGSNNTKTKTHHAVTAEDFSGNYVNYGIREHGMAAAMNGLSLYCGFIPYGGTFLVFSDYLRPALRLSALMQQGVIYVLTHDSIGLGEDGPTHQPIEHLASLRAIPNVNVFRPADGVEVAECWQLALEQRQTPSVLALSRQAITPARLSHTSENLCAKGGYVVRGNASASQVTLIATGSELGIALDAHQQLEAQGIQSHVVSLPCWRLFDQQPKEYRQQVLGKGLRVGIEAASAFGWSSYLRSDDIFIGMNGFGASAPASVLYEQFGITVDQVIKKINEKLLEKEKK
ncbi:transketolase [Candidatus Finniella inopinata]|nr:transketolase [Candidatus Finniella inopinata]